MRRFGSILILLVPALLSACVSTDDGHRAEPLRDANVSYVSGSLRIDVTLGFNSSILDAHARRAPAYEVAVTVAEEGQPSGLAATHYVDGAFSVIRTDHACFFLQEGHCSNFVSWLGAGEMPPFALAAPRWSERGDQQIHLSGRGVALHVDRPTSWAGTYRFSVPSGEPALTNDLRGGWATFDDSDWPKQFAFPAFHDGKTFTRESLELGGELPTVDVRSDEFLVRDSPHRYDLYPDEAATWPGIDFSTTRALEFLKGDQPQVAQMIAEGCIWSVSVEMPRRVAAVLEETHGAWKFLVQGNDPGRQQGWTVQHIHNGLLGQSSASRTNDYELNDACGRREPEIPISMTVEAFLKRASELTGIQTSDLRSVIVEYVAPKGPAHHLGPHQYGTRWANEAIQSPAQFLNRFTMNPSSQTLEDVLASPSTLARMDRG